VQAQAALHRGDVAAADALAGETLDADPAHAPSLVLAARLADLGGDAALALRRLEAAGRGDGDWAAELRRGLAPRRDEGRNQPCPCGSGRKFKACCAGQPGAGGLAQRAPWLRAKLAAFTDVSTPAERLRLGRGLADRRLGSQTDAARVGAEAARWVLARYGSGHPMADRVGAFYSTNDLARWLVGADHRHMATEAVRKPTKQRQLVAFRTDDRRWADPV
jgi:hypothetical protein